MPSICVRSPARPGYAASARSSPVPSPLSIDSRVLTGLTASSLGSAVNACLEIFLQSNVKLTLPLKAEISGKAQVRHEGCRRDSPALRPSITLARLLLVCAEPAINSMLTRSARTPLCRPFQAPIHRGRFFMLNLCRYARGQHITHVPVEARPARSPVGQMLESPLREFGTKPSTARATGQCCLGYAAAHETDTLWWPAKAKDTRRHARRGFGDSAIGPILPQEDDY
jgi:hypothetical protein